MCEVVSINFTKDIGNKHCVSARELHRKLKVGRDFTTWIKGRIIKYGFEESIDFVIESLIPQNGGIKNSRGGARKSVDYIITTEMAKELCMLENNEIGRAFRKYFIKCEEAYRDILARNGDKRHQLECMALLQGLLPEELKHERISYIKANTVVDKCVSNIYGFPKMIKKRDMNSEMLKTREKVLDDYLKLFEVLEDNSQVKDVLYSKYSHMKLN